MSKIFPKVKIKDFAMFSSGLIASGDIDPQFWVLKEYYKRHKLSKNQALWHTAIYLLFYHLGSAFAALDEFPEPQIIKKKDWTFGRVFRPQRRMFRGAENENAITHINALVKLTGGDIHTWVDKECNGTRKDNWLRVKAAFEQLPFSGPWSAYKWCDLMRWVHQYPILGPDIGDKSGPTAGPIAGLTSITGLDWKECAENKSLHESLIKICNLEYGSNINGLDQLESCLCDWQSIIRGRYYIGHDIDRDLAQLTHPGSKKELLQIRADLFDHRLLGEVQWFPTWNDIRKPLNTIYRDRKEFVNNFRDVKDPTP